MEVVFHWTMVAYYAFADVTCVKGALQAYFLLGRDPYDHLTSRMINGSPTYITIWNMVVQQLYFILCCREHLLSSGSGGEKARKEAYGRARQVILRSILFPTTFVVSIIYWFVYWRSPKLIFGDILYEIYPPWVDHSMHTFIVPIALFELYLSSTRERAAAGSKFKGWLTLNAFLSVYSSVVVVARLIRGVWPYPFLDPENHGSPLLFFLYLYGAGGLLYYVGQHLSNKIRGTRYNGRKRKNQP